MSLQYIPKCVWWPLGALISATTIFLIVLTIMLYKAKQVEIQLAQVSIVVKYADSYITQLAQITNSLEAMISQPGSQDVDSFSSIDNHHKGGMKAPKTQTNDRENFVTALPTILILKEKKQQLEIINDGLQLLKKQLPTDVAR